MNCTSVGELASVVPTRSDGDVEITSIGQGVVQALPVTLGAILWIVLELARRKRAASDRVRRAARGLVLACTLAIALVVWRFTTVLTCKLEERSIVWNVLACAALVGLSVLLLFALALRAPRVGILACLLLAACAVTTDVGLRGWWGVDGRLAAQHLMPVQLLWVLHAIAILFHLERTAVPFPAPAAAAPVRAPLSRRRGGAPPPRRSVVEVVDALTHRRSDSPAPRCDPKRTADPDMRV